MAKYLITGRQGSGKTIDWPEGKVDWETYSWNWQSPKILQILATNDPVFLGAVVSNQAEFYKYFDKIFVLMVSPETLHGRLLQHEHVSHHLPGEIERILLHHEEKQQGLLSNNTIPIDADRPLAEIYNVILKCIS